MFFSVFTRRALWPIPPRALPLLHPIPHPPRILHVQRPPARVQPPRPPYDRLEVRMGTLAGVRPASRRVLARLADHVLDPALVLVAPALNALAMAGQEEVAQGSAV